ncbi:hypothetical protein [Methanobacterium spitsbergense]|uniref:Uncharacterized protein n=1 Tax=Methanobacterium spitsbergense TaxID=2874285 RepID=A0A8T5UWR3_9EURY|nr:hypothetical protein [Methanobacterium spitsbergense]MBZ2166336.1 hypothetical protein [Methanobacterium spitsbergense]
MLIIGIIGAIGLLGLYVGQFQLVSIIVAGLIGFLSHGVITPSIDTNVLAPLEPQTEPEISVGSNDNEA